MSRLRFEGSSQILLDSARIKGSLLYGPPGTGKTQLVRAMASDSHSNMIAITAADIQNKYSGESEKRIAGAFSLARKLSPCILFIDEVDALFYRRSSYDVSWQRGNLTQFLQEMDGMDLASDKDAPFVIGATNHPMDLDEAFVRRLPYRVMFTLPGLEERKQILKIFLKDDDLDPLVSIDAIAQHTEGLSGSDLRSVCGETALDFAIESMKSNKNNGEPIRLQLDNGHIARALQKVQPSVTARSHKSIDEFNQQFNT